MEFYALLEKKQLFNEEWGVFMMQGHMPKNYMLEFVDEALPGYISSHSGELGRFVNSPEFILRLKVAALNLLPAKYITTSTGLVYSAYGMKEPQMEADVVSAFLRASAQVMYQMEH